MHVAVDAHNLVSDRRGIGVYVRAVLPRLIAFGACDVTLLVRGALPMLQRTALERELGCKDFRVAGRVPARADVVWHPWNGTFFESDVPGVATIHDVVPFAMPAADEAARSSQQAPFVRSARTARRIITDSEFSKGEIVRYLGIEPQHITVIPLAANPQYVAMPSSVVAPDSPYVLYVGAIEARKNTATLVEAWKAAFPQRNVALTFATSDPVPPGVTVAGNLGVNGLRDLYCGALFVAVPSLYEGFGLPALEAMACGTPVVCSRAASLPEVCGDAAIYVDDPRDVGAWTAALREMAESAPLRARLRKRGLARAVEFSWDRTASETLAVLSAVAAA